MKSEFTINTPEVWGTIQQLFDIYPTEGRVVYKARDAAYYSDSKDPHKAASMFNKKYAGKDVEGSSLANGKYLYRSVSFIYEGKLKKVQLARVIYKAHFGGEVPKHLGYLDGDHENCKVANLVDASKGKIIRTETRADNTTGQTGVFFLTREQRYLSTFAGKRLGTFKTLDEAVEARAKYIKEQGILELPSVKFDS